MDKKEGIKSPFLLRMKNRWTHWHIEQIFRWDISTDQWTGVEPQFLTFRIRHYQCQKGSNLDRLNKRQPVNFSDQRYLKYFHHSIQPIQVYIIIFSERQENSSLYCKLTLYYIIGLVCNSLCFRLYFILYIFYYLKYKKNTIPNFLFSTKHITSFMFLQYI